MHKIPLIIDTDIAGDPDDVFTLNLLLNSPEVSVELIITADEHAGHRARFAREFVLAKGHDIPVVRGIDLGNAKYCHACSAGENSRASEIGVDPIVAVVDVLARSPEARYLCLAPQSNLALVLGALGDRANRFPVRMMGGAINYRRPDTAEHNIRYDVPAAHAVMSSAADLSYVVSDTTFNRSIEINAEHPIFRRLCASPLPHHRMMADNCRAFFAGKYPSTIMHDPLTAASLWRTELVTFRETRLAMNEFGQFREDSAGRYAVISHRADYPALMNLLDERL